MLTQRITDDGYRKNVNIAHPEKVKLCQQNVEYSRCKITLIF